MRGNERWLKNRLNGRIFQYTDILAASEDFVECEKTGEILTMQPRVMEQVVERVVVKDGQKTVVSSRTVTDVVRPGEDVSGLTMAQRITIAKDHSELAALATELDMDVDAAAPIQKAKQDLIDMLPAIEEEQRRQAEERKASHLKKIEMEKTVARATKAVETCKTPEELTKIAKRYDVGFAPNMSIEDMKSGLIEQLPKLAETHPEAAAPKVIPLSQIKNDDKPKKKRAPAKKKKAIPPAAQTVAPTATPTA